MSPTPATDGWIAPLRAAAWPDLTATHIDALRRFEAALTERFTAPAKGKQLLALRRSLAPQRPPVGNGPIGATVAALAQFVCGFHDLDLRDTVGAGHGRMILRHGSGAALDRWAVRLARGELVGVAATERHGGSRLQEITARITPAPGGWSLNGEKCWVSRLCEAAAFVVFCKDPDDRIQAVIVEAAGPGVSRAPETPSGLGGWTWGTLAFQDVHVSEPYRLGGEQGGAGIFREHFASFRPLVAATALGTAAGVHTTVTGTLRARHQIQLLPRLRDTTLVTLGRTAADLNSAFLSAVTSARLTAQDSPQADVWARSVKAHGVQTAHRAVEDLAPLVGASGFRADSPIAKARQDLGGLLYADGLHDSLLRSAGRTLMKR
ncbi:acyl-CoA dehydrogenase family protein [Streptomyces sp. 8N114]|uniref:acyl-CoA dehydrogenase family protein n=1 Tax=Streptomyces sp. 8N114 TaxID=3457419 RepID=UPI003FD33BA9